MTARAPQTAKSKSPTAAECQQLAVLFESGRHAELESRTRLLLSQYPDSGFLWKALGAALQMQGRDSLPALQKAAQVSPGDAEAHNNLGFALQGRGQFDAAAASCRRALQIEPGYAEAHNNLGNSLRDLGKLDEALVSYRHALELKPDYAEAHVNLGNALQDLGQFDAALASYRRALQIKPNLPTAHNNLGNLLKVLGQLDAAEASCRQALALKPDYAEAHNCLGNILKALGRLDQAAASYRRALELKPGYAEAHGNLGNALLDLGQLDAAIASYRRALELDPDFAGMHSNLLFALNYHPDMSGEQIFAAYREYDGRIGLAHRGAWRLHANSRDAKRRLKVGYVSPEFRSHSIRHFLEPLLARHDKGAVEVFAYSDLIQEDAVTQRYKQQVDHWIPTASLADATLAERIRADGIDILVDLAGHTAKNRLGVFARKPAPVSLHWLDFGYTTGLSAIDYYLTDEYTVPFGSERLFSEQPWRLAPLGLVYRPAEGMGSVNALPALERGHVTFGTLTRSVRINHRTIRVWSAILNRVPGSRLMVASSNFKDTGMQQALAEKFAACGISRERLDIGSRTPSWDVLRDMDISLDCFPHNSGTTLIESLYMGVPYVTLAGRASIGRLGSAILQGAGHPEWIAQTEDDYVERAVALASDLPKLAALRAALRGEMEASPLMDEPTFARKVEHAYREMFGTWSDKNS